LILTAEKLFKFSHNNIVGILRMTIRTRTTITNNNNNDNGYSRAQAGDR
jgi:hypothetical protein